jgi:glutamine cyclotransferase
MKRFCELLKESMYQKLLETFMKRWHLATMLILMVAIVASLGTLVLLTNNLTDQEQFHYTYAVVAVYPHDASAFTQGLVFEDSVLYESTGVNGQSTLRCVDLESGNVTQLYELPAQFFGEGVTIFEDKLIQLTWKSGKGFVYDRGSFELLQEFEYLPEEAWGLTSNGRSLIMSDGSATLYFLDPETFQEIDRIEVYDEKPVTLLNELEYIDGMVYANIWKEDRIAIIDPETGQVRAWINLMGINDSEKTTSNVLNGIAYDVEEDRLFVTGKRWSKLFEIKLVPTD